MIAGTIFKGGFRSCGPVWSRFVKESFLKMSKEFGGRGSGRRMGGPPPGLRGRDIGLYYAKRSKEKKEAKERNEVN